MIAHSKRPWYRWRWLPLLVALLSVSAGSAAIEWQKAENLKWAAVMDADLDQYRQPSSGVLEIYNPETGETSIFGFAKSGDPAIRLWETSNFQFRDPP